MIPNRRLFRLLAIVELVLAILFAGACLYVVIQPSSSIPILLLLAFIGMTGVINGLFLIRKVKQSRQLARRAPRQTAAQSATKGSRSNGKKKS